ncbi:MAG: amidohydrolase [Gorillibacterium sp.]|nr:amidohydrolase [Gorillibacterium sp.]
MAGILFKNGSFLRTPHSRRSDAVYVDGGVIQAIGPTRELILQLTSKEYQTVDWDGGYVLPGLVDSHMHLSMHGMKLTALDFTSVTSKEEMLRLIRHRAETTPHGDWIIGLNWNENSFQPALAPTRSELDAVTDKHPIFLTRVCFHAYLANSEAYRRAGVTEGTSDPVSGTYGRDSAGVLNGWIYEDAGEPFHQVMPEPDYATKKACIRRASLDALRLGLTAAHTDDLRYIGSIEMMLRIHQELREEGVLLRSNQLIYYTFLEEAASLGLHGGSGDEWLRIGATKIFADGVLGGRTALLREPYADDGDNRGIAIHSPEALDSIIRKARAGGFPVAVHAIGDEAIERTLAAMAAHPLTATGQSCRLPDRLIHALVMRADLIERMKHMPIVADIQPHFVLSDFPWVVTRLGGGRIDDAYAWKKLLNAGIPCAGGSDAPIEPLNPFLGLYAAVNRRKPGETHEGYLPSEKLTLQEAIDLFTKGSAQAAGEAEFRGALAIGHAADFTVVDRDLTQNIEELSQVAVKMTVVNGEIAYRA